MYTYIKHFIHLSWSFKVIFPPLYTNMTDREVIDKENTDTKKKTDYIVYVPRNQRVDEKYEYDVEREYTNYTFNPESGIMIKKQVFFPQNEEMESSFYDNTKETGMGTRTSSFIESATSSKNSEYLSSQSSNEDTIILSCRKKKPKRSNRDEDVEPIASTSSDTRNYY